MAMEVKGMNEIIRRIVEEINSTNPICYGQAICYGQVENVAPPALDSIIPLDDPDIGLPQPTQPVETGTITVRLDDGPVFWMQVGNTMFFTDDPPSSDPYAAQVSFTGSFLPGNIIESGIDLGSLVPDGEQEVTYDENMPGMTLEEFQAWSDQVIRDVTS